MIRARLNLLPINMAAIGLASGVVCSSLLIEGFLQPKATSSPSLLEFRWENSQDYRKLYYYQSSKEKRDRSTYYLVLKPNDRKTAILKLSIKVPDYFNASIPTKNLSLCKVNIGGMLSKTRCIEKVPAIFEINKEQTNIDIFPNNPIPAEGTYAVVMKIFNPTQSGMFQFNALGQPPGDIPISRYIGSWTIDIN